MSAALGPLRFVAAALALGALAACGTRPTSGGQCRVDSDCAQGRRCANSECVAACAADSDCAAQGFVCRPLGMGALCVPPNDSCDRAQAVVLTEQQAALTLTADTAGATHDLDAPCGAGGELDLFYSFSLTQAELVYADTFGSAGDTVLFFAQSCTQARAAGSSGDEAVCNDDASARGCAMGARQSQVVARLDPGTHYLVVSTKAGQAGAVTLHLQHLPAGNGPALYVQPGTHSYSSSTAGTGSYNPPTLLCPLVNARGPENAHWWTSCPEEPVGAMNISANTCSGTSWDTMLYGRFAGTAYMSCNNDAPPPLCGRQSRLTGSTQGGAGLYVVWVDGPSSSDFGPYSLSVTRP